MIAFDGKRAFQNTSGLGNYSRTHITQFLTYFSEENCLLFTPKVKIPFIENSERAKIITPSGFYQTKLGSSFWRSYKIAGIAADHNIKAFHGLSNEMPMNAAKFSFKKIVTIHDLINIRYPHYYSAWDRRVYHNKVRYACENADVLVCISKQTQQDLMELYGVSESQTRLVYQDCAVRFHIPSSDDSVKNVIQKYELQTPYILSVGTFEPRKKQLQLIKAFAALNEPVHLVFVGRKTAYQKLMENAIRETGLLYKVKILNEVVSEDLPALYRGAVFSSYLSEYEGFGLPIIESLNQGTPVLSSSRSCLPEAAGPGGWMVDPDDVDQIMEGIKILLYDQDVRQKLSQGGMQHVLNFRAENTMPLWKEIYFG